MVDKNIKTDIETEEDLDIIEKSNSGEKINDRPSSDLFFNTEEVLRNIELSLKGYTRVDGEWVCKESNKAIARDDIINKLVSELRGLVNPVNMHSEINEKLIPFSIIEHINSIVFSAYDDPTVDDNAIEVLANIVDEICIGFYGHMRNGRGNRTIKTLFTGLNMEDSHNENRVEKRGIF